MINMISSLVMWLKGYRQIPPNYLGGPRHTPKIPEKPRDRYGGDNLLNEFAKTEGYINTTPTDKENKT